MNAIKLCSHYGIMGHEQNIWLRTRERPYDKPNESQNTKLIGLLFRPWDKVYSKFRHFWNCNSDTNRQSWRHSGWYVFAFLWNWAIFGLSDVCNSTLRGKREPELIELISESRNTAFLRPKTEKHGRSKTEKPNLGHPHAPWLMTNTKHNSQHHCN